MTDASKVARLHYQAGLPTEDPIAGIIAALNDDVTDATAADLEGLDQFHAGGVPATLRLGRLLSPARGAVILDAGSGLGGPARVIAEQFGCHVTGVDLTPSYVDLANRLSERTKLAGSVDFRVGDLLSLPFAAGTFDGAYTQHVVMNVSDRDTLYSELRRVLKKGAGFAFHDVVAVPGADGALYPTPWAQSDEGSFILDEDETVATLQRARLHVESWEDVTDEAVAAIARLRGSAARASSLATVMGARFSEMTRNYARNLSEGHLRVVMGRAIAS